MPSETLALLIPIVAVVFGGILLLVPIAGLTLRFALKPAMEAYAKVREINGQDREIHLLEQRVALLEERLRDLAPARPGAEAVQPRSAPVSRIAISAPDGAVEP